jgi:hypothetical protein
MSATLEIAFPFSACFDEAGGGLAAHNYTLRLMTRPLPRADEKKLRERIDEKLIRRIGSRDLGKDVDFLKGQKLTESVVLAEFLKVIASAISPQPVFRLSLERADGTRLTLVPDER